MTAAKLRLAPRVEPKPAAPESILAEADRIVSHDRGLDYGHPSSDFGRTAKMWAAILGIPYVSPEQVALCMIAVKISREVHRHKRDNLMDIAGYAKCAALIHERKEEQP